MKRLQLVIVPLLFALLMGSIAFAATKRGSWQKSGSHRQNGDSCSQSWECTYRDNKCQVSGCTSSKTTEGKCFKPGDNSLGQCKSCFVSAPKDACECNVECGK